MDWSTLFLLIAGIGGLTLLTVSLVSKWTGSANLVTSISTTFSAIWNVLKSGIDFVLNHMPKPLRVFLVIVLFTSVGGLVYANTVGVTHVCGPENKLYTPNSVFQGWAYVHWPTLVGEPVKNVTVGQEGTIGKQNFLKSSVFTDENGETYNVTQGLVPLTVLTRGFFNLDTISKLPAENQFRNIYPFGFFPDQEKLLTGICLVQINDVTVCYMQENSPFLGGGGTKVRNPELTSSPISSLSRME